MTKHSKSGGQVTNKSHTNKSLEDHIIGEAKFAELGVQDAPTENIGWDVKKAEVHSSPVEDPGTGKKVIVRRFSFRLPPGLPQTPSKEEILDYHLKHTVIPMLWKDELALMDLPRIILGKKGAFSIVALCEPQVVLGVLSTIHEPASNVTEVINDSSKHTK